MTRDDYHALLRDLIAMRDRITAAINAVTSMLESPTPTIRRHEDAGAKTEAPPSLKVVGDCIELAAECQGAFVKSSKP